MVSGGTGNWPGILLADWQRLRPGRQPATSKSLAKRKPGHNMKKRLINVHSNWQLCHAALLLLLPPCFLQPNVAVAVAAERLLRTAATCCSQLVSATVGRLGQK